MGVNLGQIRAKLAVEVRANKKGARVRLLFQYDPVCKSILFIKKSYVSYLERT